MSKKRLTCFLLALFFSLSVHAFESFELARQAFSARWEAFQEGMSFIPFESNRTDDALIEEFKAIKKFRHMIWNTVGFERAEHLIANDLVRAPGCAAFSFNNIFETYNASAMFLNERAYIACEGPRSKDIPSFFKMLSFLGVSHLVRLTDSHEGETIKCHPYWEDKLTAMPDGSSRLDVPTASGIYPVRAYDLAHWRDCQGIEPGELLDLVLKVRDELQEGGKLLAVHCSAGVGRTGTFLAALSIVDAIDQKTHFSIEEIVYRLSLQRVNSVGNASQYVTLHRLAEEYLERRSTDRSKLPAPLR